MKWLYANPIVLNLVISIIALLITFFTPLAIILIVKALFVVNTGTLGFIGALSFVIAGFVAFMWSADAWRHDGNF